MKVTNCLFTLFLLCCQSVNASIITLDGNNIRYTGMFVEGDYKITAPLNEVNGGNLAIKDHLNKAGFSGDYMETWNTDAIFTFKAVNGDLFDIIGLDVSSYFSANYALSAWTFRGFSGSQEIFSLVNNQSLGRLDLGWTGLTSFTIQSSRGSAASSFDNIEVLKNEQKAVSFVVSEPSSLAFFSLIGFALLGRIKRSKFN